MLHTKFHGSQFSGSREEIRKGCNRILAWGPSWSCDPGATNKLSFLIPVDASNEIWLLFLKRFRRRYNDGR